MNALARVAVAGLAVVGGAAAVGAADIKVQIDSNCELMVSPSTGTHLSREKGDTLTWSFVNQCAKARKVRVCPLKDDPLLECEGPPPAAIRRQFRLAGAATKAPTPGVAACNVDYSVLATGPNPPPVKFKYCVVSGLSTEPDLMCPPTDGSCGTMRPSEIELNVDP